MGKTITLSASSNAHSANVSRRKRKLRAIDNGTRYDIVGRLKHLARQIEHGKLGDVRDVVIGVRDVKAGGKVRVAAYHYGTGSLETALYTWECTKGEIAR